MLRSFISLLLLLVSGFAFGQKVDYKEGLVSVDKEPVAKINSARNSAGIPLVKDYFATNLEGQPLFSAVYSDLIPEDPNDNTVFYFEFRFEGLQTPAYLPVSKLGGDKTIANYIGKFALVKNQALDLNAVRALVQQKGKTPPYRLNYDMVARNRQFPVEIREAGKISQASTEIGTFSQVSSDGNSATYVFNTPAGIRIATAVFSGGNNARSVEVVTLRDNVKHTVATPGDNVTMLAAVDSNYVTVKKIAEWLVQNGFL